MSLYDATQKQRAIERKIRKWKRESDAMEGAGLDNTSAIKEVKDWQATQRDFISQTGLKRDYFRERAGAQNGTIHTSESISWTLSGKAFKEGNPDKPVKAPAPDTSLQNAFTDGINEVSAGTPLTDVRVIAGESTRTPLKDTPRLNAIYAGDPLKWQKKVGTAEVDGEQIHLHWYENDGVMYEEKRSK